ncbi:MAG: UDP-N-acetylmuramoyl-L-alanine--D-glutamate ligase [Patescibacteria group bacterium]|nr:UDP-N-acetylmuramoyl-L-alanine--D-glutamate ligase [Patescibacteria group bacterium]
MKQKILILGLGQFKEGSGISAALFFARKGHEVRVTDQKTAKELGDNVKRLKGFKNVKLILGKHRQEDIRWADMIVRNPRVRPDLPEMKLAMKLGKRIESDSSLFMTACPCPIVGITGTRGKSTTTSLIGEMLKKSGKRVWVGGNILVSPLTFLSKVKKGDICVLEYSSWQLETTGLRSLSPHIAVITNIMRDHLNSYEGMDDYVEAKAQIFRHQSPDDYLILNKKDGRTKEFADQAPSQVLLFKTPISNSSELEIEDLRSGKRVKVIHRKDLKLLGEHNVLNFLAAATAAKLAGASMSAIKSVGKTYKGLENRLETIATKKGVRFVNDTTSTTPDAAIAALKALKPVCKKIHLIAGGADKELEFKELAKELKRSKVSLTVFEGTAFKKLTSELKKVGVQFERAANMKEAFEFHVKNAEKGDCILLSPGCASFGIFKNEFDRGEQFKSSVSQY